MGADVPFTASAATGAAHDVEFKKRPFGILRYQPGQGGTGAMTMEIIPKSRYPGDPQGQAFSSGVQPGWVVKSVNGEDVLGAPFGKITALALETQGGRMAEPVEPPIKVTYAEVPGYVWKGATL